MYADPIEDIMQMTLTENSLIVCVTCCGYINFDVLKSLLANIVH